MIPAGWLPRHGGVAQSTIVGVGCKMRVAAARGAATVMAIDARSPLHTLIVVIKFCGAPGHCRMAVLARIAGVQMVR